MRATLHDELMRDAGLETDYHREERRRQMLLAGGEAAFFVFAAAELVQLLWADYLPTFAHVLVGVVVVLGFVVNLVLLVKTRLLPWVEDQI